MRLGRIERRVPDLVPADVEVVMEEEPDLPGAILKVRHPDMAHQDILVEIHSVVEQEINAQDLVPGAHLGDHGVDGVTPVELPV